MRTVKLTKSITTYCWKDTKVEVTNYHFNEKSYRELKPLLKELFTNHGRLYTLLGLSEECQKAFFLHPDDRDFDRSQCNGFKEFCKMAGVEKDEDLFELIVGERKLSLPTKEEKVQEYVIQLPEE